jgi:hypothetical protein
VIPESFSGLTLDDAPKPALADTIRYIFIQKKGAWHPGVPTLTNRQIWLLLILETGNNSVFLTFRG